MKTNHIAATCMLGLTIGLASCGNPMEEIHDIIFERNLSPIGLEVKNIGENGATLTWTATTGAKAYQVEIYADDSLDFKGKLIITTKVNDPALALKSLVYDTRYSARVMVLDATDAARNSKWTGVYFRTAAQQILTAFSLEDTGDKDVIAHWPATEEADQIVGFNKNSGKKAMEYTLTADDKSNGRAHVTGLQPETEYTLKLYKNGKERGSKTFKTIADLSGATIVRSTDNFSEMLEKATQGQVFALYNGTYKISAGAGNEGAGAAVVNKSITIKGIYPTAKPKIQGRFQLEDGAGLTMKNVIVDGTTNATNDQFFNYKTATTYAPLDINNCEFYGAQTGGTVLKGFCYINVAATVEAVTIRNSSIHDVVCDGGDLFDCRKGYIKTLTIDNNIIYNCATERDFIRYDDAAKSFSNPVPQISLTNNTIDHCMNGAPGKRILYVRFNGKKGGQQIKVAGNIFSNTQAVYTNQATTSAPQYANNYYYNCNNPSLFAPSDPANKFFWNGDTSGRNGSNPQYKDPTKGDYTVGNESVAALKVGAIR